MRDETWRAQAAAHFSSAVIGRRLWQHLTASGGALLRRRTRSRADETRAPFTSPNIMSEEPAGDSRLFQRMGSLKNKAELGKICCVQAERRLLCPD